jgi:acyl-CoA thioesterase-1
VRSSQGAFQRAPERRRSYLARPYAKLEWLGFSMNHILRLCSPIAFAASAAACDSSVVPTGATQPVSTVARTIAVLADSLAISPSRSEGFPAVLQQRLEASQLPWTVTNHGVRGDTTAGGLRRIDGVLAQRPAILILALGANDGLRGVDVTTISRNVNEMIVRARKSGAEVLLCGMETLPVHGWNYTLAFHRIFPSLAREHDIALVPFLLAGVALNPEMNGDDLVHPNAAGARHIAATLWPYLEALVRTP